MHVSVWSFDGRYKLVHAEEWSSARCCLTVAEGPNEFHDLAKGHSHQARDRKTLWLPAAMGAEAKPRVTKSEDDIKADARALFAARHHTLLGRWV